MNITIECKKWACSVVVKNFPDGQDAEVTKAAIRYFLYYKHGDAVRAGQREFDWTAAKVPRPRGPVVMKTETLEAKLEERIKADPTIEYRQAADRYMKRKGCGYSEACAWVVENWDLTEEDWPHGWNAAQEPQMDGEDE